MNMNKKILETLISLTKKSLIPWKESRFKGLDVYEVDLKEEDNNNFRWEQEYFEFKLFKDVDGMCINHGDTEIGGNEEVLLRRDLRQLIYLKYFNPLAKTAKFLKSLSPKRG